MKKAIVTTTINPPTKALKLFAEIADKQDWHMFIVGDRKTDHAQYEEWSKVNDRITYLGPDEQEVISRQLSDQIGWNCIQRRNMGFIAAYGWGAEIVATIDDDNIPLDNWGEGIETLMGGTLPVLTYDYMDREETKDYFLFDPLAPTNQGGNIWHRGYPVQMLKHRRKLNPPEAIERTILVRADLWNGDPDIDAICRIAKNPIVKFDVKEIYAGARPGPFNSQNTFLHRSVLRDYFMFPGIGRMDDIWASYFLQSKHPGSVVYGPASVNQVRNEHDLVKDLDNELIGYHHTQEYAGVILDRRTTQEETLLEIVRHFIPDQSYEAFMLYRQLLDY